MTAKRAILPEGDLMVFVLNLAGDRHVARFSFLGCARRQYFRSDRFQCFALFRSRFLVDVIVREVPVAERFHHGLALRALPHSGDGESIEFNFSVISLLDEKHLAAAAGHLGRFGTEPAGTRGVARAGFFELAGNFPWGFVFGSICGSKGRSKDEEAGDENIWVEGSGFHSAKFYRLTRAGQVDFVCMLDTGLPAAAWQFWDGPPSLKLPRRLSGLQLQLKKVPSHECSS